MRPTKKEIKLSNRFSMIQHLRPHQQRGLKVFSLMSNPSMRSIGMTPSHSSDALVVNTRTKVIHCISQAAGEVTDSVYDN